MYEQRAKEMKESVMWLSMGSSVPGTENSRCKGLRRDVPGRFEKWQGDQLGWSEVSKGVNSR